MVSDSLTLDLIAGMLDDAYVGQTVTESLMFDLMAGFAVFVGLFLLSGTSWMLYNAVKNLRTSARRDEFDPVEARVLGSELTVSTGESTSYNPNIEYEYTVAGKTYTSESVYPGTDFDIQNKSTAESLVETYSEGDIVEAYYDPANPTDAFLENKSVATGSIIIIITTGFGTVVGLGLVIGGALWLL